jgi:hypothetical protein
MKPQQHTKALQTRKSNIDKCHIGKGVKKLMDDLPRFSGDPERGPTEVLNRGQDQRTNPMNT